MNISLIEDMFAEDIYVEGEIRTYGERWKCFIKQVDHTGILEQLKEGEHTHFLYELNEDEGTSPFYDLKEIKHTHSFHEVKEIRYTHTLYELKEGDEIEIKDCLVGDDEWMPGKVRTEIVETEGYTISDNGLEEEKYTTKIWLFDGMDKTIRLREGTPARIVNL